MQTNNLTIRVKLQSHIWTVGEQQRSNKLCQCLKSHEEDVYSLSHKYPTWLTSMEPTELFIERTMQQQMICLLGKTILFLTDHFITMLLVGQLPNFPKLTIQQACLFHTATVQASGAEIVGRISCLPKLCFTIHIAAFVTFSVCNIAQQQSEMCFMIHI